MKYKYITLVALIFSFVLGNQAIADTNTIVRQTYVGTGSSSYCAVQDAYNQIYSSGKSFTISNIRITPVGNNSYMAIYSVKQPLK